MKLFRDGMGFQLPPVADFNIFHLQDWNRGNGYYNPVVMMMMMMMIMIMMMTMVMMVMLMMI